MRRIWRGVEIHTQLFHTYTVCVGQHSTTCHLQHTRFKKISMNIITLRSYQVLYDLDISCGPPKCSIQVCTFFTRRPPYPPARAVVIKALLLSENDLFTNQWNTWPHALSVIFILFIPNHEVLCFVIPLSFITATKQKLGLKICLNFCKYDLSKNNFNFSECSAKLEDWVQVNLSTRWTSSFASKRFSNIEKSWDRRCLFSVRK